MTFLGYKCLLCGPAGSFGMFAGADELWEHLRSHAAEIISEWGAAVYNETRKGE